MNIYTGVKKPLSKICVQTAHFLSKAQVSSSLIFFYLENSSVDALKPYGDSASEIKFLLNSALIHFIQPVKNIFILSSSLIPILP